MTATDPLRASAPAPTQVDDISLAGLLAPLVRRRRMIALCGLASGIGAAIYLLLAQPVYTARTAFTPESASGGSSGMAGLAGLAGVAGQLGLGTLLGGGGLSQDFLADVVTSQEILRATLQTSFPDPADGRPRPLLDILGVSGRTPEERLQRGATQLSGLITKEIDRKTGIVTLKVEMPASALAAQVANRLVALLDRFNLEQRQSQSRAQRRFTGERLDVAERELRAAEQAQLDFVTRNRGYAESPVLSFEAARLDRQVRVRQEVYLALRKGFEEARIAEVRDIPVLTIIDTAIAPAWRTRPRRTLGVLVALVLGVFAGAALAFVGEARRRFRHGPQAAELQEAWASTRASGR